MLDMIGDWPIEKLGLHRGVPLRPAAPDIAAYEDEVARREQQSPEAVSHAGLAEAAASLSEEDLVEADGTPQTPCSPILPTLQNSFPSQDIFDGPNIYDEDKQVRASQLAFAKSVKQAHRRRPVRKQMTGVWLQKLGSKSLSQRSTQEAVSQEGCT